MAFNKAKALEKAQALVAQNKLKEAVAEFQKIHKADPNDQTTLNTLGDLNVRLKNVPEALNFYTRLADVYVKGGFLVRGIAMFKKISKIDPKNTGALERLAELYTMQGLMSEARSHYLQLGEALLKDNKTDKALEVMQKLLDLEPDNIQVQKRLAELYERHNQNAEAATIYRRMGDRLLFKGEADQCLEWLDKAAQLDPKDTQVFLLQARAYQQTGKASQALAVLEKIPNPEQNPEAVDVLVGARLASGDAAGATDLAEKQFATDASNFAALLQVAKHAAENHDAAKAVELLQKISEAALENDPFNFLLTARQVSEALPESIEAANLLVEAGKKTGDESAQTEGLQRKGTAAEAAQNWKNAKEAYNDLLSLDPANTEIIQLLNQVRGHLGEEVAATAPPPAPVAADDGSAVAAAPSTGEITGTTTEELDNETRNYVESAMADIDLFANYGMPDQALEKAQEVIAKVPNHREMNEKLLDLYLGASNDPGVAEIAQKLEGIYRQIGNTGRADELAEMASKYGAKAAPEAAPAAAAKDAQIVTADVVAEAAAAAAPGGSAELDLTAEWASMVTEEAAPEAAAAPAAAPEPAAPPAAAAPVFNAKEASDEIDFYLSQGRADQATAALANYERDFPGEPALAGLRAKIEAAAAPAKAAPEPPPAPEPKPAPAEAVETTASTDEGQSFDLVLEPQSEAQEAEAGGDFFSDLAGELEETLANHPELKETPGGSGELVAEAPAAPAPAAPEEVAEEDTGALADILNDFKQDLGDVEEEVEDVETHYNLGIAYKEMGLYEEAISEFQKSVKAAEKQKDYRHVVQSCILLALCFRERGMAKVAVTWYERSLKIPGLDDEADMAIRYDMAEALEESGEKKQALDTFMAVYGTNVDYRNVGERIRDLQGS